MKSSHIKCLNAMCHRPSRHTVVFLEKLHVWTGAPAPIAHTMARYPCCVILTIKICNIYPRGRTSKTRKIPPCNTTCSSNDVKPGCGTSRRAPTTRESIIRGIGGIQSQCAVPPGYPSKLTLALHRRPGRSSTTPHSMLKKKVLSHITSINISFENKSLFERARFEK
jgi:hypothetical protein